MTHFIGNQWIKGCGPAFSSTNPATGKVVWQGPSATAMEIKEAFSAGRSAFAQWSNLPLEKRIAVLNNFRDVLTQRKQELAGVISEEMGKPLWESLTEVGAMIAKIPISIEAYHQRTGEVIKPQSESVSTTRHKSHGIVAVFGPFNFPGHLPNGHIVPALLAGNVVLFKPSELTPLVAKKTVECWEQAGIPSGVLSLIQGGRETGHLIATHPQLDGLFFTGSASTGKLLSELFAKQPGKILALEMGGNNPLVVAEVQDLRTAAYLTVQSAYLTSGQRCTCARRLIVPKGAAGDDFLRHLVEMMKHIKVGPYTDSPEPFMGPVISHLVAQRLLSTQTVLTTRKGKILSEMKLLKPLTGLISPGLIDVTEVSNRSDEELFGPLLQVIRVKDFEAALEEANRTSFGLSAGLLSDKKELYDIFYRTIRAGVVNWNTPTTGASSAAPFGGVGCSGNHHPSAYYAADYCAYPVASLESPHLAMPPTIHPGISL